MNRPVFDVALLPSLVSPESLMGQTVVVVDVLRATTTIVSALNNGCSGVMPQPSVEAARATYQQIKEGCPKWFFCMFVGMVTRLCIADRHGDRR